jgi:hypothetical protein
MQKHAIKPESLHMEIVAIIAARNEELYLGNCLNHLAANSVKFAIIDDGSTDATYQIVHRPEFRRWLVRYLRLSSDGVYRWTSLLECKMQLAGEIAADWFIHHDSDEVMHSYRLGETLADAIRRIAQTGANVINLDEFVFLPVDHDYVPDSAGSQPLRHYYFFEPHPLRLNRIWKSGLGFSMVTSGGHQIAGDHVHLAKETLALRHYIVRDQDHASAKYNSRVFDPNELAKGWHLQRHNKPVRSFQFPSAENLKALKSPSSGNFDKSDPKISHYWDWQPTSAD